jgi:hypothetical protein
MAINGRINVDVLFHDTDGTTSLKVVSLEDSTEYTTGKVAIVTGTCGTAAVAVSLATLSYKDASGEAVGFNGFVNRVAFSASPGANLFGTGSNVGLGTASRSGEVNVVDTPINSIYPASAGYEVSTISGTASYTLVIYGT